MSDLREQLARVEHTSSESLTLAQVRELLRQPEVRAEATRHLGEDMRANLTYYLGESYNTPPVALDEACFTAHYDPSLPTIAIDANMTFSGSELIGVVAAEQPGTANIFYFSPSAGHARFATSANRTANRLDLQEGAMILPGGVVAAGSFPAPVSVDRLETTDANILRQCNEFDIPTFNTVDTIATYNDKSHLARLLEPTLAHPPARITPDVFRSTDDITDLVIKPTKHSQGRGVLLTDETNKPDDVHRLYDFLDTKGYEPVIEERIKSWPLRDPESGERLDWNVRALASQGELVGMYVRADTWGMPVNLSLSARALTLDQLADYINDSCVAEEIIRNLSEAAESIAHTHQTGLLGIDLTIDETGTPRVFEVNGGNAGGLQTIARITEDPTDKCAGAKRMLDAWLAATCPTPSDEMPTVYEHLEASLDALVHEQQHQKTIATLSPEAVTTEHAQSTTVALWAIVARNAAFGQLDIATVAEFDRLLFEEYPLELQQCLGHIITGPANLETYNNYLTTYESLFPADPELPVLRGIIAAKRFDLQSYQAAYQSAIELGVDEGAFQHRTEKFLNRTLARFMRPQGEPAEIDPEYALEGVCRTICIAGVDVAIATMTTLREQSSDSEAAFYRDLEFLMTVSLGHYDQALALIASSNEVSDAAYEFVLNSHRSILMQTPEGVAFFTQFSFASGSPVMPIIELIDSDTLPSAEINKLIIECAMHIPLEGSDDDRYQLASLLHHIRSSLDLPPSQTFTLRDQPTTDIAKFTTLLAKMHFNTAADVSAIMADFEERDILGSDLEYCRDVLEELRLQFL
jgi:hypothetical protein